MNSRSPIRCEWPTAARPTGLQQLARMLQSSAGFFSLQGPLNLAPGAELGREERTSGHAYICDALRTQ